MPICKLQPPGLQSRRICITITAYLHTKFGEFTFPFIPNAVIRAITDCGRLQGAGKRDCQNEIGKNSVAVTGFCKFQNEVQ